MQDQAPSSLTLQAIDNNIAVAIQVGGIPQYKELLQAQLGNIIQAMGIVLGYETTRSIIHAVAEDYNIVEETYRQAHELFNFNIDVLNDIRDIPVCR
jgi:hypothetical protein